MPDLPTGVPSSPAASGAGSFGSQPSPSPVSLSDDTVITYQGAEKPVAWRDFRSGHVPRAEHDAFTSRYNTSVEYLIQEARRIDQWRQYLQDQARRQTQGHGQDGGRAEDPLASVRDLPLVDGQTIASLYDRIQKEGFGPLHRTIQAYNQMITAINRRLDSIQGTVGSMSEERASYDFDRMITAEIKRHGYNPEHPAVREASRSLYLSYEPGEDLDREFPGLLKDHLTQLFGAVREHDRAEAARLQKEKRVFPSRGGTATPGQPQPYRHLKGRDLAAHLFASTEART